MAEQTPRVYIAYTATDLYDHAKVVWDQLHKLRWVGADHRDFAASGLPPVEWCREKVCGVTFRANHASNVSHG